MLEAGELEVVNLVIDYDKAPQGSSQVRLLVNSDDSDESTFPGGVFVNVTKLPPGDDVFANGFEGSP